MTDDFWIKESNEKYRENPMNQVAQDMALERITLWQDFTQPNGYRDTLTLVHLPGNKWCYEFQVSGTVQVVKYNHFWKIIE